MSTLYLTFIPLPPPSQSRSRSASIRGRIRSREASQVNSRASSPMRHANGLTKEEEPSQSRSVSRDDSRSSSPRRVNGLRSVRDVTMLPGWKPLVQCAEVVAVCRVRDAMGKSMDPMMGLLKFVARSSATRMVLTKAVGSSNASCAPLIPNSTDSHLPSRLFLPCPSLRSPGSSVSSRTI